MQQLKCILGYPALVVFFLCCAANSESYLTNESGSSGNIWRGYAERKFTTSDQRRETPQEIPASRLVQSEREYPFKLQERNRQLVDRIRSTRQDSERISVLTRQRQPEERDRRASWLVTESPRRFLEERDNILNLQQRNRRLVDAPENKIRISRQDSDQSRHRQPEERDRRASMLVTESPRRFIQVERNSIPNLNDRNRRQFDGSETRNRALNQAQTRRQIERQDHRASRLVTESSRRFQAQRLNADASEARIRTIRVQERNHGIVDNRIRTIRQVERQDSRMADRRRFSDRSRSIGLQERRRQFDNSENRSLQDSRTRGSRTFSDQSRLQEGQRQREDSENRIRTNTQRYLRRILVNQPQDRRYSRASVQNLRSRDDINRNGNIRTVSDRRILETSLDREDQDRYKLPLERRMNNHREIDNLNRIRSFRYPAQKLRDSERKLISFESIQYIPNMEKSAMLINAVKVLLITLVAVQIASSGKVKWFNSLKNFVAVTKEKVL